MKTYLLTFLLLISASFGFAQSLWINDPQDWRSGQGTIEETKIICKPVGLYMKVDWEITFSAKGQQQFTAQDTVEVVYNFRLPEGSIINDSWLWFGDTILKALILDRWTASQVYENIVGRRRDPSILTKNWNNNYELRIFPMAAKESRKVKISFLTPTNWINKRVTSYIPAENLRVSKYPIDSIRVFAALGEGWKNPVIKAENDIPLEPIKMGLPPAEETSTPYFAQIEFSQLNKIQHLEVESPMKEGYYLSFFENDGENFYQLAINPGEGLNKRAPQKLLFLIDYREENSDLSQSQLLNLLSGELAGLLSEKDSFNIFYNDIELKKASENWIAADSASIYNTIKDLGENPFVSYSNLASLMASGIEYAEQEAGSKIILLTNSNEVSYPETANDLIEDLLKLMDTVVPVYIGDFQSRNLSYWYSQNYEYRGSEYFYMNLAKLTGGDYVNIFDGGSFASCVSSIVQLATGQSGLVDIHTTLNNGFCYGRNILSQTANNPFSNIFLEVGKYSGEFPFKVEISGLYNEELFSKTLTINKENAFKSDSVLASFWYGNEMLRLENSGYSYSAINEIIDISLGNRLLSKYTAFLCLEPGMLDQLENVDENGQIIDDWGEGPVMTETKTTNKDETEITAYPNPFTDKIDIEIQLSETVNRETIQLEIYDLFGKRIKAFNIDDFDGASEFKIRWDATNVSGNLVPKGTYLFVCTTSEGRITKKLILM